MFNFKLFRNTSMGVAIALVMSVTAAAQTKVLVVDSSKVVNESEVGKHVARQVEAISKTMSAELQSSASTLKASGQSLNAELQGKTPAEQQQVIQSRPDLQKKYVEFMTNEQKIGQDAKVKEAEIKITSGKAKIQIANKVQEIIEAIAKERGADLVLDKSVTIYSTPIDITDAVMDRLNKEMTRISVVRERLPRKAPAQ